MMNIMKLPQRRSILKGGSSSDYHAHGIQGQAHFARLGCWLITGATKCSISYFGTEREPVTEVHSPVLTAETVEYFKDV